MSKQVSDSNLKEFLNSKAEEYNQVSFIKDDPICIPHLFTRQQDIEIAGFFAAVFAWGNRKTIINKSKELMQLMDMQPYHFCLNQDLGRLKRLLLLCRLCHQEENLSKTPQQLLPERLLCRTPVFPQQQNQQPALH